MPYKVKANIVGKRTMTDITFSTKAEAQKYARDTNLGFKGANARVVKVR